MLVCRRSEIAVGFLVMMNDVATDNRAVRIVVQFIVTEAQITTVPDQARLLPLLHDGQLDYQHLKLTRIIDSTVLYCTCLYSTTMTPTQ